MAGERGIAVIRAVRDVFDEAAKLVEGGNFDEMPFTLFTENLKLRTDANAVDAVRDLKRCRELRALEFASAL